MPFLCITHTHAHSVYKCIWMLYYLTFSLSFCFLNFNIWPVLLSSSDTFVIVEVTPCSCYDCSGIAVHFTQVNILDFRDELMHFCSVPGVLFIPCSFVFPSVLAVIVLLYVFLNIFRNYFKTHFFASLGKQKLLPSFIYFYFAKNVIFFFCNTTILISQMYTSKNTWSSGKIIQAFRDVFYMQKKLGILYSNIAHCFFDMCFTLKML